MKNRNVKQDVVGGGYQQKGKVELRRWQGNMVNILYVFYENKTMNPVDKNTM